MEVECLDLLHLNKNIKIEVHHIPTLEEISADMNGAKFFSTLDADKAFWQVKLDEESTDLVTFDTPFGRYKFLRMPYGILSASEVFQRCFQEIFGDLEGVKIYIDNVLLWGKTKEEHDERLRKVLEKARERNVKFNKSKCKIAVNEVKYLGHKFTDKGLQIDDDRIKAIKEIKTPKNKKGLETFLGIINYVNRYVPNHSQITSPLRNLTKVGVQWNWGANEEKAFNDLKNILIEKPVLNYYNVKGDVVLSVDASQFGLGCVLLQNGLPVAYGSKALTDTKVRANRKRGTCDCICVQKVPSIYSWKIRNS